MGFAFFDMLMVTGTPYAELVTLAPRWAHDWMNDAYSESFGSPLRTPDTPTARELIQRHRTGPIAKPTITTADGRHNAVHNDNGAPAHHTADDSVENKHLLTPPPSRKRIMRDDVTRPSAARGTPLALEQVRAQKLSAPFVFARMTHALIALAAKEHSAAPTAV